MQLSQVRRRAGEENDAIAHPYQNHAQIVESSRNPDDEKVQLYFTFCKINTLQNIPDTKLPQKLQMILLSLLLYHTNLHLT
jgi:hypothetical protein